MPPEAMPPESGLPGALSSDEMRAAARLAGYAPLPAFDPGWAHEELGVADAVALRGLLARGLATVCETPDGPDVRLTPGLRTALDPLLRPDAVTEIHVDEGPAGRRRHLVGESGAGALVAAECRPSIWDLRPTETPATAVVRSVAEPLIPDAGAPEERRFTVSGHALSRADLLLARSAAPHLPQLLRGEGLDEAAAADLAGVLSSARALVTVRTVRITGAAAAVCWLDAGPAGLWLVAHGDQDHGPDEETGDEEPEYTITAAGHEDVRGALGDALEEQPCLIT